MNNIYIFSQNRKIKNKKFMFLYKNQSEKFYNEHKPFKYNRKIIMDNIHNIIFNTYHVL